ncbi:RNA polymerase sigma-70 factor [Chitinophaga eiseniae]|uniref:RNA polymerase sigma-70 factor n=1 Tax=Chitinophaga eiseniae TaxID=634771 RepID=A0A847SNT7_9BACT|nr:RNA polymerase sigma-70 factor [Chitinophaga eiseniae]NLR79086.1 RNA polymerase sigma-70 factor [Chitinophaga eiseniae]
MLLRLAEGENAAFRKLYDMYYSALMDFAHKLTGNMAEAEDITLRTFAKLYERPPELSNMTHLRRWLFLTVRNDSLNYLKKRKYIQSNERNLQDSYYSQASLDAIMTEEELVRRLYNAIELLPAQRRRIFILTYLEGYKAREIAELLGISENTVNTQKKRALVGLRSSLGIVVFYLLFYR